MKTTEEFMPSWQWSSEFYRQLPEFCEPCQPQPSPNPQVVFWNAGLAETLALETPTQAWLAQTLSGNCLPESWQPVAQAYAGHQFGHFNPQLGDGRAHLLGELQTPQGLWQDIALKGSGATPFSRGGDGRAALGPMLREVLLSESLHALGIPTTRSLAVVTTGEPVYRQTPLQGAVLARTAASHLRIGTFQWASLQVQQGTLPMRALEALADFAIARHYPSLTEIASSNERYMALFEAVVEQQAQLVAQWMGVGFIHGVMNTDNMSIAGETIDFGPCAMLEHYDPQAVFSSIDHQGRYAFDRQPSMAQWNLARLGEALMPLLGDDEAIVIEGLRSTLQQFTALYQRAWLAQWRKKLGVEQADTHSVAPLVEDFLALLSSQNVDFTLACRGLSAVCEGRSEQWLALFAEPSVAEVWLHRWKGLVSVEESRELKAEQLRQYNPVIVARNHHVERALSAAESGDLSVFQGLLEALQHPYDRDLKHPEFAQPAPPAFTKAYQTFCGT